jgi:hypothetical protein
MADYVINENYNPGFAWYQNFYTSIEHLPIEQQKEICYAIVKYGITGEMVNSIEMPLGYSFTMINQHSIDDSVQRWVLNQNKASYKIDKTMSRDLAIAKLIKEGLNSKEIAEQISEVYGDITDSAIRKTSPWREKNDKDFDVKWLGEECEFLQNSQEQDIENVNSQSQKIVNDPQIFTGKERENSQENEKYHGAVDPRF